MEQLSELEKSVVVADALVKPDAFAEQPSPVSVVQTHRTLIKCRGLVTLFLRSVLCLVGED